MKTTNHPTLPFALTHFETAGTYRDQHGTQYALASQIAATYLPPLNPGAAPTPQNLRLKAYASATVQGMTAAAPETEMERRAFGIVDQALAKLSTVYEILATDQLVFDPVYEIVGVIDLPARNRDTGAVVVIMWEARESLADDSGGRTGLAPCAHIRASYEHRRRLEASICGYMLTDAGYFDAGTPIEIALIHVNPVWIDPIWHDMPYRAEDAAAVMYDERVDRYAGKRKGKE